MSDTFPEVRVLPMDSELEFEGRSIEEVQLQFFLKELLGHGRPPGRYSYREKGLRAPSGAIVLFQYASKIIASATFDRAERFKEPNGPYKGALYFDAASIRIFDPVGPDVVSAIWPEFTGFSQVKWSLDPKKYPAFEQKLVGVEVPT